MKISEGLTSMTPLTAILIGLLTGTGITGGVLFKIAINKQDIANEKVIQTITDATTIEDKAEAEVTKKLSNVDIASVPCSLGYIEKYGDGLCRETLCRMYRQGNANGATSQECDEIANLNNSVIILDKCLQYLSDGQSSINENNKYSQCVKIFEKRK